MWIQSYALLTIDKLHMPLRMPVLKKKHTTPYHAYYKRHQWPNGLSTSLLIKRSQVQAQHVLLFCKTRNVTYIAPVYPAVMVTWN